MSPATPKETVKLWRLPELGDVELMRAAYRTQTFSRHSHEGYALGVIERGALGFFYRGQNVVAPAGAVNLANPDEPHTGHPAMDEGWTYRMFYFEAPILQQAASTMAERCAAALPFFQSGVLHDDHLAGMIYRLHRNIETGSLQRLELESRFLQVLTALISRHADAPPASRPVRREPRRIRLAREVIEARYQDDLSLDELSSVADLSPFHFLRVFRDAVGLPPHAYHTQVRVEHVKRLLRTGWSIAAAAVEAGFVDQSHLTRCFKRITGVTPGQYRKIVQDP
ncbi:MAG: AraC family ligand binding domain-containing protein [Syntrophobacteraceae bacterium]